MALTHDRNYNLKTYSDVLLKAREVFAENNINTAQALNLFLKNVAMTGKLDLLDEEELERIYWSRKLQDKVQEGVRQIQNGDGMTLDFARAKTKQGLKPLRS